MKKYNFTITNQIDKKLATQWKNLWNISQKATVFNSYEWFLASTKTVKIPECIICTCYQGRNLVAIMPLFSTKVFGVTVMKSIGYKYSGTPFLSKSYDKDLMKFFFSKIFRKYNLYIPKIDSEANKILRDIFPESFTYIMSVNPFIDRRHKFGKFTQANEHKNVRKIMKDNTQKFELQIFKGEKQLKNHINEMFYIEQNSTKKLKKMDLFSSQANKNFFINLSKYCGNFVQLLFLKHNDKQIAYDFVFTAKNTLWAYQCAFLDDFRNLAPGLVITIYELDSLENSQIDVYDLGGGISSYKQRFTSDYYLLYDLLYSKNVLFMTWWKLITYARRVNQILFPIKNTRDNEFLFKPSI